MGFRPTKDYILVQLVTDYKIRNVTLPENTSNGLGKGKIVQFEQEVFDAEYCVGDVVVFKKDGWIEMKIADEIYYLVCKDQVVGVIV